LLVIDEEKYILLFIWGLFYDSQVGPDILLILGR